MPETLNMFCTLRKSLKSAGFVALNADRVFFYPSYNVLRVCSGEVRIQYDSIIFNLIMRSTFVSLLRKGMPNLHTSDD